MPGQPAVVGRGLAAAFLAGEWEPAAMARRGRRAVAQRRVWVRDLALAARSAYPSAPLDRPRELAELLSVCPPLVHAFAAARARGEPPPSVRRWFLAPTAMGATPWPVAPLPAIGDLQDMLGLTAGRLHWFADPRHLERTVDDERLRHYRYRWVPKGNGGARLIEEPKPLLKHFQRVLLREILERIPVHPAAHGFRRGHSALTYASAHTHRRVVVHLDLEDFFVSVTAGRVFAVFRRCGYPEPVAHLLTGLVTNSVPAAVRSAAPPPASPAPRVAHHRMGRRLASPHLPQGAPTSPVLANLAAFRLDRRLTGLAAATGTTYLRYADDLAFSAASPHGSADVRRLVELVARIASEEGFGINPAKTTVRRSGQRQRLAGVVVNDGPNVDRRQYETLKATIHNAARHGPAAQNRASHPNFREHLLGRISWVAHLNPTRGERLRAAFSHIDWADRDPAPS